MVCGDAQNSLNENFLIRTSDLTTKAKLKKVFFLDTLVFTCLPLPFSERRCSSRMPCLDPAHSFPLDCRPKGNCEFGSNFGLDGKDPLSKMIGKKEAPQSARLSGWGRGPWEVEKDTDGPLYVLTTRRHCLSFISFTKKYTYRFHSSLF